MMSRLSSASVMSAVLCMVVGGGCRSGEEPAKGAGDLGTFRLSLESSTSGRTYRLSQAVFTIDSTPPTVLSSDPLPNPDVTVLTAALDVGSYNVTLAGGWVLHRLDPGGPVQVNATLLASTIAFDITAGATTSVPFQFATDGTVVVIGTGTVSITTVVTELTTWDPTWSVPGVTYSNGNLSISGNSPGTKNVRTNIGRSAGRYYWEITATGGDININDGGLGILEAIMPKNSLWIGSEPSGLSFGYAVYNSSQYWFFWSGVSTPSGPPPAESAVSAGKVYMFALDLDAGTFWAGHDGAWYNAGNPATGANPAAIGITGTVYPGVTLYEDSGNAFTANFGASAFLHPVPAGFTAGFR